MNILEKNQHVLEHLRNKVLLSQKNVFYVILGDLLTAGITVSEVITILDRLQSEKMLNVLSANPAEKSFMTLGHKMMSALQVHERDLSILTRNELDKDYTLEIRIEPNFMQLVSSLTIDPEEKQILKRALSEDVSLTFPIEIFCPNCRSKICKIKDQIEWEAVQLNFSSGKTMKCKDRRHSCSFCLQNGKVVLNIDWTDEKNVKEEIDEKKQKR